ncbi:hypothetical protein YC2023_120296 [Brassica napus]
MRLSLLGSRNIPSSLGLRKRETRSHGKVLVFQLQPPHVICQDNTSFPGLNCLPYFTTAPYNDYKFHRQVALIVVWLADFVGDVRGIKTIYNEEIQSTLRLMTITRRHLTVYLSVFDGIAVQKDN